MRKRRYPRGVIVHSDRGGQFRSRRFQAALSSDEALGLMGRVGACGDNAAMESFFALLQKNVSGRKSWASRQELSMAITGWIERTYHRKHRTTRAREIDTHRIRDHHETSRTNRGLKPRRKTVNQTYSRPPMS